MKTDTFVYRSRIPASAAETFGWHLRPGAFERLAPPWERIRLVDRGHGVAEGSRVRLEASLGPVRTRWTVEHRDLQPGRQFRDVQIEGPFAHWEHTHTVEPDGPEHSWLEDRIEFALPLGQIGWWLGLPLVRRKLQRVFAYRHSTTAADLAAHAAKGTKKMRIAVTGSSGLVGRSLVPFLTTGGHPVTRIVRGKNPSSDEIAWDPILGSIDHQRLEEQEAVVHLAGENIASGRWTARRKKAIRDSRLEGTRLLCQTLAKLRTPPQVLVCASAIGFYGSRGDQWLDEASPAGSGFLADLCREWEAAAEPARARGIRVVHMRFGIVLSPAGGALAKMLTPFKLGLGGVIGNGRQWWSWIALDDAIGAIHHSLMHNELSGAVNAVSPDPSTNRGFTKALGRVLSRPTVLPVPALMARLALGQMADELLLASARVAPRRLQESGYEFRFPQLDGALEHLLGKSMSNR